MATSCALPGLPTGLGATTIQASTILIPTNEYQSLTWASAQRKVKEIGSSYFNDFPTGKDEDPNWQFYTRADMGGSNATQKTIIGMQTRTVPGNRSALNTTTMVSSVFSTLKKIIVANVWHFAEITLTNGSKYWDVQLSAVKATILVDPETGAILVPTSAFQAVHEALGMVLKPVAGAVPVWDPAYAALGGLNPNAA
jgi:hypothetical protein